MEQSVLATQKMCHLNQIATENMVQSPSLSHVDRGVVLL